MVLLWVYYTIIKFNINEKKFRYKNARPSVSSLTVSSPTDSRQPDSRTNHPQTKSIIARAQILIDLNQIKFDEEFDIYKIKEDNKDECVINLYKVVLKPLTLFFYCVHSIGLVVKWTVHNGGFIKWIKQEFHARIFEMKFISKILAYIFKNYYVYILIIWC